MSRHLTIANQSGIHRAYLVSVAKHMKKLFVRKDEADECSGKIRGMGT